MLTPLQIVKNGDLDLSFLAMYSESADKLMTAQVLLTCHFVYGDKESTKIDELLADIERYAMNLADESQHDLATQRGLEIHNYVMGSN